MASTTPRANKGHIGWRWLVLVLIVAAWLAIEALNLAQGRALEAWALEYAGGGSCKLRGSLLPLLLLGVLWVYPAVPVTATVFLVEYRKSRRRADLVAGVVGVAILARFVWLHVASAALGLCP